MVVKLVERSDPTKCLIALVRLLKDCVGSQNCSTKFEELVMKCLWKHSQLLEGVAHELDLDSVLYEMHLFLLAFPAVSWRDRASDTPLRTVKTILNFLARYIGPEILSHTHRITEPTSEVVSYLRKAVKNWKPKEGAATTSQIVTSKDMQERSSSKSSSPELDEIFKKIYNKDTIKEAIEQLYDYKRANPNVDIEQYLSNASQNTRDYINRKLRQVEMERGHRQSSEPPMGSGASLEVLNDPAHLAARLKELRRLAGLENPRDTASTTAASQQPPFQRYLDTLAQFRQSRGMDNADLYVKFGEQHGLRVPGSDASSDVEFAAASRLNQQLSTLSKGTPSRGISTDERNLQTPKISAEELENLKSRLAKVKQASAQRPKH